MNKVDNMFALKMKTAGLPPTYSLFPLFLLYTYDLNELLIALPNDLMSLFQ